MFKARYFNPPIKENDIEIAKRQLKNILGLTADQNTLDDLYSDTDDDEYREDEKEFFVVEKVLDQRIDDNGDQKFDVKWVGHVNRTWEPFENFVTSGSKMAIFLYFKNKWERKLEKMSKTNQDNGVASNSNAKGVKENRAAGNGESSKLPAIKKNEKSSEIKARSSTGITVKAAKQSQNVYMNGSPGSSKTLLYKCKNVNAVGNPGTLKVVKNGSEHESKNKGGCSGLESLQMAKYSGEKRIRARSSHDNIAKQVKSNNSSQSKKAAEIPEKKKKEKEAEEERLPCDEAEYGRLMQKLKDDLGSSDDEEFIRILKNRT